MDEFYADKDDENPQSLIIYLKIMSLKFSFDENEYGSLYFETIKDYFTKLNKNHHTNINWFFNLLRSIYAK